MNGNGTTPTPEQRIAWLQKELDDAHLVIGRQQVQLLQMQQALMMQQAQQTQEQEADQVAD
jgi:hypothetical protein